VLNTEELKNALTRIDSIICGVPYYFNLALTKISVEVGANVCNLEAIQKL